jgi:DedD protein
VNEKRGKAKKNAKRYSVELSVTSIFFWGLGLLFLLVWIFVLGILVGRGFLPDGVKSLTNLKAQFNRFQDRDSVIIGEADKEPEFEFHYKLATRKNEAIADKSQTRVKKKIDYDRKIQQTETSKTTVYTVQLSSLENKNSAAELVNTLKNRGYPAYYNKVDIGGKTYYRVRCGKFKAKKQASDLKTLLAQNERLDGFVTSAAEQE